MSEPPLSESALVRFFLKRRAFEHETTLFLLASLLDFFMTYWLLLQRADLGIQFQESNPVARFFLDHWGIKGLLTFKLAIVLFIVALTMVIAEKRPAAARAILLLGIAGTAVVVIYSLVLMARHMAVL